MATRMKKYRKRAQTDVAAVQLSLDTKGFAYKKWGAVQRCKAGDWLVNNDGEVYTVDSRVFARTYREVSRGVYRKVTPVWAVVADEAGEVRTKEGVTKYQRGWYLVYNDAKGKDGWAMRPAKFRSTYVPAR